MTFPNFDSYFEPEDEEYEDEEEPIEPDWDSIGKQRKMDREDREDYR